MKSFFNLFTNSAKELKSVRCLATTGILIALFIVLDTFSIKIGAFAKINFAFTALSVVGMLFGPVPAMLAAVAGDLIGCVLSGQAPLPLLTVTAALEGLVFGIFLYKKEKGKLAVMAVVARLIDSFVINLLLNTWILMSAGFMSQTGAQFVTRIIKISIEALIYCPFLAAILPAVLILYNKASAGFAKKAS
ncbi:MAG: folate family ECF transporter S component [Oscillospiraceae bacterium]|nr:folate family ECF transporter S component [Oscillospiraceae bacterium]